MGFQWRLRWPAAEMGPTGRPPLEMEVEGARRVESSSQTRLVYFDFKTSTPQTKCTCIYFLQFKVKFIIIY